MASLGTWLWGTSQLDDAVDKATSELLPAGAEDIALNLEICDQIRSKSVPAKDAMRALKRRLNHKNPNVQILALSLTDVCIKNGGDHFLTEIASREFVDNLVSILKIPALNHDVKTSILRHLQNWATAFEGKSHLSYVGQVYKNLQREGYNFPPRDLAVANSVMVDTQTAPEWIDSEVCLRCRTAFTFTNRKHHCRNCGQVFDHQCSSKSMPLPHFGITQQVRVCDGCHNKLHKKAERSDKGHRQSHPPHSNRAHRAHHEYDSDLQRAIQASLEAASQQSRPGYVPAQPSEPPIAHRPTSYKVEEDDDLEFRAAIAESLRLASAPRPSAPVVAEPAAEPFPFATSHIRQDSLPPVPPPRVIPSHDLDILEEDAILTFNQTVEQIQSQGIRDLSRFPAVTELYDKASGLRPKIALSLDESGRKEQLLAEMHANLSEAVKLYDKLLTEQIARPRWRTAQPAQYQPQPPVQAPEPQSPQRSYSQPQSQNYSSQWSQSPAVLAQAPPSHSPQQTHYIPAEYRPATTSPISQAHSMQQQTYTQPITQPVYQPPLVSLPPQQHTAYQPETPSVHPVTAFPPPPSRTNTLVSSPAQPITSVPPPQAAVSVPPPQPQPQTHPQQHIYHQPPPQPMQTPMSPPPQLHQQPQPKLPQFPVAPTLLPRDYAMYGPNAPTSMPVQEERKEGLLIDL